MEKKVAIKILVVDSRAIIGRGISKVLQEYTGLEVVAVAGKPEEVFSALDRFSLDVISMDINFPNPAVGLHVLHKVRRDYPHIRSVILTNQVEPPWVLEVMKEGVQAYLLKDISANEFVDAIRKGLHGEHTLAPEVIKILASGLRFQELPNLTPRELQVLDLVAKGKNNQEIARELKISLSTAQFHVSNILQKLNVDNRIEAATFAVRKDMMAARSFLSRVD